MPLDPEFHGDLPECLRPHSSRRDFFQDPLDTLQDQHPEHIERLAKAKLLHDLARRPGAEQELKPVQSEAESLDDLAILAVTPNDLAAVLQAADRLAEAEPLMRRAPDILLDFARRTGYEHPHLRAGSETTAKTS